MLRRRDRPPASSAPHVGALLVGVLLLTACAAGGPTPGADGRQAPTVPTETNGDAPAAFTERPVLPSCGSVELDQGEPIPQEAIDCLAGAGAGGAELIVTSPTVEGDPIVSYYRALPGGGIEVFSDMTQDAFGGGWGYELCEDATTVADGGGCAEPSVD